MQTTLWIVRNESLVKRLCALEILVEQSPYPEKKQTSEVSSPSTTVKRSLQLAYALFAVALKAKPTEDPLERGRHKTYEEVKCAQSK